MSKARTLANLISDNAELADGQISVSEVVGAASLASPTFTGTVTTDAVTMNGYLTVNGGGVDVNTVIYPNGIAMEDSRAISFGTGADFELSSGGTFLDHNLKDNARHLRIINGLTEHHRFSGDGNVIFNNSGADADFRVESDSNTHALFVDAGNNRIGINESSPDAFLDISGNGATTSKMFEISTVGIGGGPTSTFYGGYVQVQANNNATDNFGWYVTANHSGIDSDTTGIYGLATMNSSSNRSIGAYGSSSVNSGAVHNAPGTASSKVAAGVYAEAITTGTSSNSTNAALIANNKTTSGNLAYGAFIKVNSGATNPVPLAVDYDGYNVFDVTASDATFNEDSADRDFRVESDSNANAFLIDAGNNLAAFAVPTSLYDGSAGNSPSLIFGGETAAGPQKSIYLDTYYMVHQIHVNEGVKFRFTSGTTASFDDRHLIKNGEVVFNETSQDSDFRVESDNVSNMLLVDASSNRVSIGRSNPLDTLHVQAYASTDSAARFEPNSINPSLGGADPTVMVLSQKATALDLNRYYSHGTIVQFRHNNDAVGSIYVNGSSTTYYTSSDYRLKENVVELTGATDRLKQLQPKRFNFIADADTTVDGFLAHEVQSIVPEAIGGAKDEVDADGNPVYQGIDQSKLVPLLVKTIQELEARITALENA